MVAVAVVVAVVAVVVAVYSQPLHIGGCAHANSNSVQRVLQSIIYDEILIVCRSAIFRGMQTAAMKLLSCPCCGNPWRQSLTGRSRVNPMSAMSLSLIARESRQMNCEKHRPAVYDEHP